MRERGGGGLTWSRSRFSGAGEIGGARPSFCRPREPFCQLSASSSESKLIPVSKHKKGVGKVWR